MPSLMQLCPYWSMSTTSQRKDQNYISFYEYQSQLALTNRYNEQAYEYFVWACFVETPDPHKRINASLRSLAVNREQCSRDRGRSRGCVYGTNNGELLSYPFPSPSLPPPPPTPPPPLPPPPPPPPPPPLPPPTPHPPLSPPPHYPPVLPPPPIPLMREFLFVRFHFRTEISRRKKKKSKKSSPSGSRSQLPGIRPGAL